MAKTPIEQPLDSSEVGKPHSELTSAGTDVRSDVASALSSTEKREISPDDATWLISKLKARFESPENEALRKTIDFAAFEKRLRDRPKALYALYELEVMGGKPQVVGMDGTGYILKDNFRAMPIPSKEYRFF